MILVMNIPEKLQQLGHTLPTAPKPIAAYLPAAQAGNLLFISGQLPMRDGKLLAEGPVPSKTSLETAQKAAAQCAVNAIAIVGDHLKGEWSRIARVVRVGVFVQSDTGFHEQAKVANGASELLQQVFGEAGRHARAAVGTNALPLNAAVEVEFIFEIRAT
jgi:enamine deaminase RidA (YjgF/YER057c/UK114 family)